MRSNPIDRLRCFRRTQREYFEDEEEKRRSASHSRRQKERKRLSNEDAETFLSTSSSKRAGRGKNSIPQTSFENWKTKRKRKKLLSFSMQSSSTRKSRRRLQSEKREREREKKSIIVIGCVPPKKDPDHPVFLLARGRVGKACLSVQSLFFEYSMSASKVCCTIR